MPTERFLYRSLRAQIVTFQKPRNIIPVGRFWAKIGLNKLSQMFIRSGEIPSPRQTSIDKINVCGMKSKRGALVTGSDPPSAYSVHKTTGDTWRVPGRLLIQTHFER